MIVKITQADINKAKEARRKFDERETWFYCRGETCPLAIALKRIISAGRIFVSGVTIYNDNKKLCDVTGEVKSFIEEADKKKDKIRPRELEIAF